LSQWLVKSIDLCSCPNCPLLPCSVPEVLGNCSRAFLLSLNTGK
jgi:hypothetical protein